MKLISMKCPECSANLDVDMSKVNSFIFCQYCNAKIYIDNTNTELEQTKAKYEYMNKTEKLKNRYHMDKESMDTLVTLLVGLGICAVIAIGALIFALVFA